MRTQAAILAVSMVVLSGLAQVGDQGRYEKAIARLNAAQSERDRFYALNDAAMESMNVGKVGEARRCAEELQTLLAKYPEDWNYGNAVQDVHIVLGRLALRAGKTDEAKTHLLEAGKSPGSPQMNSFGPNMTLARDLIERGEKEVVLQYFDLCAKFWKMDLGKLGAWRAQVEKGEKPDFGPNLIY